MNNITQLRSLAILAMCVALALLLGICIATPDSTTIAVIGTLFCIGLLPLALKWHHTLLIATWNATICIFFLPGQPDLWMITTALSLFLSLWARTLSRDTRLRVVPFLSWPLLFFGAVVVITALARRTMELESGYHNEVRRYFFVIVAIMGFFALSFQRIPKNRAMLCASLFFLSGVIAVLSDLIFMAGPKLYFLYYLLPAGLARLQASHEFSVAAESVFRMEGLAWAAVAFACFLLVRYGTRGILDFRHPWRMFMFLTAVTLGLFGGFRSRLLLMGTLFFVQFSFEGLWKTRWFPALLGLGIVLGCAVLPFTEKLPHSFQRSLSFLPVKVSPVVERDAEETLTWRVEMWRVLRAEVPKYFWFGKGYTYSAANDYLLKFAVSRGWAKSYDSFILTGEYHNGPLSILVPFGIWGLMAFIWLVAAGWWALYRNYRYGDEDLRKVNTFLLTYYTTRVIFFFAVYGAIHAELMLFTGVLGLSLAINGGVRTRAVPPVKTQPRSAANGWPRLQTAID